MADLATVQELSDFAQLALDPADASAALLLSIASGMVRSYLQQEITQVIDDVEYADPVGPTVFLDQLPVTSVSKVEYLDADGVTWLVADPKTYTVSRRTGVVAAKPWTGVTWPYDPDSWRVTYTHGYVTVPDELKAVVLGVAARTYSTPVGIDMERTGQRQVKYAMESAGFSGLESAVLDMFKIVRLS